MFGHRDNFNLLQLAFVVVILVFVWQLRVIALREPGPTESLPEFDFETVRQRFEMMPGMMPVDKLYDYLGRPNGSYSTEPEMKRLDGVFDAHPDRYPSKFRNWSKWVDANDPQRWIAVMICEGTVYHVVKSPSLYAPRPTLDPSTFTPK